jgi:hypothetical protein
MRHGGCTARAFGGRRLTPLGRRLRWRRGVVKLACLTLLAMLYLAATSVAANDRILYLKNQTLWSADSAGGNQRLITEGPGTAKHSVTLEALSPNGQTGVYAAAAGTPGIYLVNLATGEQRVLYGEGGSPMFSPDGKKVIFSYNAGSTEEDIATINIDGTGFTKLITWKGKQYYPDFSPDGTKIAFTTNTESKGKGFGGEGTQVFVANANGTSAVRVTHNTTGVTQGSIFGFFSPSGTLLAFVGLKSGGSRIYTVSTTGTNQTQITTDTGPTDSCPSWSPDGTKIAFTTDRNKSPYGSDIYTVNSTGGSEQPLIVGSEVSESMGCPRYRHVSNTVHTFDYLAAHYEPVLRFDTSERWRPVNVESFFQEKRQVLCDESTGCATEPLSSSTGLNADRSSKAYIKVAGERPNSATYHSPYAECLVNGLLDCDTGPKSAIYYRSPGVFSGYEYVDYWYFYRLNFDFETVDFHEGDWEGATVAPALEGDSFDYAAFTQHGTYYSYARSVLRCEDTPASSIPAGGTCTSTSARIDDMVSKGLHANFTTPCSEQLPSSCRSNQGFPLENERGYDGTKRWGRAYEEAATSLIPMPAVGTSSWVDWPGKWGSPKEVEVEGSGPESPAGPGRTFHVECASLDNEPACETGPRTASVHSAASQIRGDTVSTPGLTAISCANWAGAGISAVACNPEELRRAVLAGHLGVTPQLELSVHGERGRSGGGRGIVQFAGEGALASGAELSVGGHLTKETELLVRAYDRVGKRLLLGRFALTGGGRAHVARVGKRLLRLRIHRSRHGHLTMSLGPLHSESVAVLG